MILPTFGGHALRSSIDCRQSDRSSLNSRLYLLRGLRPMEHALRSKSIVLFFGGDLDWHVPSKFAGPQ